MIKGGFSCIVGFEDVAKREAESFGCKNVEVKKGFITFETKDYLEIARVAYLSRTAARVISVLEETKIGKILDKEAILKIVKKVDGSKFEGFSDQHVNLSPQNNTLTFPL